MGQKSNFSLNQWQILCIFLIFLMGDSIILASQSLKLSLDPKSCAKTIKEQRKRKEELRQKMLLVRNRLNSQDVMEKLGLEAGASVGDLKRAYHSMQVIVTLENGATPGEIRNLNEAYTILLPELTISSSNAGYGDIFESILSFRKGELNGEALVHHFYLGYVKNILMGDTGDNYTYTELVRQKLPDLLHDYPALRGLLSNYGPAKPWLSHIENGSEKWSKFLGWIEAEKIFELNRP
ncbi:MAG: hypothetical protein IPJ71_00285 [Bdellovibrionales bacterium]|nr:hypothetical protein [Bdellovibrionales bacterium]